MYAEAERTLMERIARALGRGLESPHWAEQKLMEVQFLQMQTQRLVADLGNRAASKVAVDLAKAYNLGGAQAAADLAALLKVELVEVTAPLRGLPPVELLVAETMGALEATGARILRSTMDIYRSVVSEAAGQALAGGATRRQAAQLALNRFAEKGITGFVDKAGRGWNLESYTEMAMRTSTGRAAVQGHLERLQMYGQDLVIVSDAPRECPLCRPWEGRVLSISGTDPGRPTVDEARAAGLHHPNCRHSLSLYQRGATKVPRTDTADPKGYADTQKLRYLERQTRAAKRVESVAMDEAARKQAAVRVRAYQAKIREHVDSTGVKRLRYREQIGRAI